MRVMKKVANVQVTVLVRSVKTVQQRDGSGNSGNSGASVVTAWLFDLKPAKGLQLQT